MFHNFKLIALGLLAFLSPSLDAADLKLAGIFTNNAIIQRNAAAPVWGWGDPGEQITLTFAGQSHTATADSNGKWRVTLTSLTANATGQTLVVQSNSQSRSVSISNVVIGDIWLCAGQSNMALKFEENIASTPEVAAYAQANLPNPLLRVSRVPIPEPFPNSSPPLTDTSAPWQSATIATTGPISSVGVMFGQKIQSTMNIPIGIIDTSRGGSGVETWTPTDAPLNNTLYANWTPDRPSNAIGLHYNLLIAPIIEYAFTGVLWYQGEGNVWSFADYDQRIANLMGAWRTKNGRHETVFIMTETAPFWTHTLVPAEKEPTLDLRPKDNPRTRFAETIAKAAREDGRAWTITITDAGDKWDIHPPDKSVPAARYAAMALSKVYQQPGIAHGPTFQSQTVANGEATITFATVGAGLIAKTITLSGHALYAETLEGFEIAGADRVFYRAQSAITSSNTVKVWHPRVPTPVAVRYAWADFPLCNLYNTEGFAAYPFRTDDWPWTTPANPTPLKANHRLAD